MPRRRTSDEAAGYEHLISAKLRYESHNAIQEVIRSKVYWFNNTSDLLRTAIDQFLARVDVEIPGLVQIDSVHALGDQARRILQDREHEAHLSVIKQRILKEYLPNGEYQDAWREIYETRALVEKMPSGERQRKCQLEIIDLIEKIAKHGPGSAAAQPNQEVMSTRPSEAQEVE